MITVLFGHLSAWMVVLPGVVAFGLVAAICIGVTCKVCDAIERRITRQYLDAQDDRVRALHLEAAIGLTERRR